MKINVQQLDAQLAAGKLNTIYLISGEDIFLKQTTFSALRNTAKKAGFTERIRITFEAGYNWDELYTTLYASSLFAEKKIIELDFRDVTLHKTASDILVTYANAPNPSHLLLLDCNKIDVKIAKSAWYLALESKGTVVTVWPIAREQLPGWILDQARKKSLNLSQEAANLLADYVEGNLAAAHATLEKLALLQLEGAITVPHLEKILTDESRFTVFDLTEQLLAKNTARSIHILSSLQQEGLEPVLVLWAITRELRLLADFIEGQKSGANFANLCQLHRIFPKRQPLLRKFLAGMSIESCWELLDRASYLDRALKSGSTSHIWQELQSLCVAFTAIDKNTFCIPFS
jgi:DNA polymerase III subunit delta